MKRHLVTAAILLVALSLYVLGFSGLGGAAIVVGAAFELWFWVRLIAQRNSVSSASNAGSPTPK